MPASANELSDVRLDDSRAQERIEELIRELGDTRRELAAFKRAVELGRTASHEAVQGGDSCLLDVVTATQELFPGEIRIEVDADPSEPDERFVVFNVRAAGDLKAIIRRERDWHERLCALTSRSSSPYRLSVVPTE